MALGTRVRQNRIFVTRGGGYKLSGLQVTGFYVTQGRTIFLCWRVTVYDLPVIHMYPKRYYKEEGLLCKIKTTQKHLLRLLIVISEILRLK